MGRRHFSFLGWSNSELKQHACWMYADPPLSPSAASSALAGAIGPPTGRPLSADALRALLGDFSRIDIVAKCAARLGQCFTSAVPSVSTSVSEWAQIPDVTTPNPAAGQPAYVFSDGVGTVSLQLAQSIYDSYVYRQKGGARRWRAGRDSLSAEALAPPLLPSAFQIRWGGVKGMISIDTRLAGRAIRTRESQMKFASAESTVEICRVSRPGAYFLNRQIITLLSTLGVPDAIFLRHLDRYLLRLQASLYNSVAARALLLSGCADIDAGITSGEVGDLLQAGFDVASEPFLRSMLATVQASRLRDLRGRARVHVEGGVVLLGVMDELKLLRYGEAYLSLSSCSSGGDGADDWCPFLLSSSHLGAAASNGSSSASSAASTADGPSSPSARSVAPSDPTNIATSIASASAGLQVALTSGNGSAAADGPSFLTSDCGSGHMVTVTRCPCFHPGDIRVLRVLPLEEIVARAPPSERAAARAYYSALVDVILFPAQGSRPHPDECSGGEKHL